MKTRGIKDMDEEWREKMGRDRWEKKKKVGEGNLSPISILALRGQKPQTAVRRTW